jgi:Spy/CpxP family protein refolding chaperone
MARVFRFASHSELEGNPMKTLFAAALFAATVAGFGSAGAMPLAPAGQSSDVIHVAGGCGPGFHRGPMGGWGPGRRVCRTWW